MSAENPGWGCFPIFLTLFGGSVVGAILLGVVGRDSDTLQVAAIVGGGFGAYCIGAKKGLLTCAGFIIVALAGAAFYLAPFA